MSSALDSALARKCGERWTCHVKRNVAEYEGTLNVDSRIVTDLVAACETVAGKLGGSRRG